MLLSSDSIAYRLIFNVEAGLRPHRRCPRLDRRPRREQAGAGPEIEFMRLSSYGVAKQSSGAVRLLGDVRAGLAGRPVLLVDDIVDTGRSIAYAAAQLRRRGIGDLWTCALLDKPQRREIEIAIDLPASRSATSLSSATAPTTPRNIAICPISGCGVIRRARPLPARRPCLSGGGSAGGITHIPYISRVRQHPCARFPQREQ
jgi:hypothetical protein